MENAALATILAEIKSLRQDLYSTSVHVEALEQMVKPSISDFDDKYLQHQRKAEQNFWTECNRKVRAIDEIIEKLESS